MTVTLLHTAEAHVQTFEALRAALAPTMELKHKVRSDWLDRAQSGLTEDLLAEVAASVAEARGPVICTCTTIGPAAEAAGAMRIDWPMMQTAARIGGPIVMAYALDSTWAPSLALLERALAHEDRKAVVHPLALTQYWPLFEAGETQGFTAVIAGEIRQVLASGKDVACVVLAQASMAGAAALLADLPVPVLSSPDLALRHALSLGQPVPIAKSGA